MSQENYMGLAFSENLKKNPDFFNLDGLDKQLAEVRKTVQAVDAKNTKRRQDATGENLPRAEFNRLRKQLYDLQQNCKCYEIRVNEAAGQVKLLENNIEGLLRRKKAASAEGQLGEERVCEHQIELLETESLDARDNLTRQQRHNHGAVRELKVWKQANDERLAELQKIVG